MVEFICRLASSTIHLIPVQRRPLLHTAVSVQMFPDDAPQGDKCEMMVQVPWSSQSPELPVLFMTVYKQFTHACVIIRLNDDSPVGHVFQFVMLQECSVVCLNVLTSSIGCVVLIIASSAINLIHHFIFHHTMYRTSCALGRATPGCQFPGKTDTEEIWRDSFFFFVNKEA